MGQVFYADPKASFQFPNGAIGYRPTQGPFDCLGPYARVNKCPIAGTPLRLTAYATGYADTYFSVPAFTRHRGRYITGYFALDAEGGIEFRVHDKQRRYLPHNENTYL